MVIVSTLSELGVMEVDGAKDVEMSFVLFWTQPVKENRNRSDNTKDIRHVQIFDFISFPPLFN